MTSTKIAVLLVAIAVLIPAALMIASSDAGSQTNEKIVTTVSLDEDELNFSTLTEHSELIIEGNVLNSYVFAKPAHENQVFPDIYTKYEIKVGEVLKGETDQGIITIVTHGGEIDDRISVTEAMQIKDTDTVILFLEKNGAHYTADDDYNPIAPVQGVFLIKDDIAKSGAYSDVSKSDLVHAIDLAKQN